MDRNRRSDLDIIWVAGGSNRLKQVFNEMALHNRVAALERINDERLSFPVYFILMPEISAHHLYAGLNERNRVALRICARKIYKHEIDEPEPDGRNADDMHQALRWMFDTGKNWSGPSRGQDAYDSVIDYVSALLVIDYDDKEVLRDIADLIFWRNRQGLYIHDLVWAFFQSLDRDALAYIAAHLVSNNKRDAALAATLLGLEAANGVNGNEAKTKQQQFIGWLNENKPYLYLTGEHFQMTSAPKHLDADNEAKYLGKEISPRYRAPVKPLTENEVECLHRYRAATPEEQALLANYSHKLRGRDARRWSEWLESQTSEQVAAARMTYEVI